MRATAILGLLASLGCLACATEAPLEVTPVDITAAHVCALDGMLIAQHDGPKAQLLRRDGSRALYCDAGEVFGEWLDTVRQRRVAGLWFQPLEDGPWEAHASGWAAAQELVFVVGSRRMGAMGPTFAPFRTPVAAAAFVEAFGGTVVPFDDIDAAVLQQVRRQGLEQWSQN